jgi:hypothetical protein
MIELPFRMVGGSSTLFDLATSYVSLITVTPAAVNDTVGVFLKLAVVEPAPRRKTV